jgi:hypothetical protein
MQPEGDLETRSIEEMAMGYALAYLDVGAEGAYSISSRRYIARTGELQANNIRKRMYGRFGVYATIMAITAAKETLQMVIPGAASE